VSVWGTVPAGLSHTAFTPVSVYVDSAFLHEDFQLRFRNIASLTGNLDHWHLDYVVLEKGRVQNAFSYVDVAVSSTYQPILKRFNSMPWDHFLANPALYRKDSQYFVVRNNQDIGASLNYARSVYNAEPSLLDTFSNLMPNLSRVTDSLLSIAGSFTLSPFLQGDTVLFNTRFRVALNAGDNIPTNDTLSVATRFSNYFAYDDGTAEAGYGIKNAGGAVALAYEMSFPDTLYGMAVYFNQSAADVKGRPFNLVVYEEVGNQGQGQGEKIIRKFPFSGPVYMNSRNGFYYFRFDEPIPVKQRFYIGWEQTELFELNVGLDENYEIDNEHVPNPNMYVKFSDQPIWRNTELTGALMMRPIVGKWMDPPLGSSEVSSRTFATLRVFPNPATSELHLDFESEADGEVWMYDMTGREVMRTQLRHTIVLPSLNTGVYLMRIVQDQLLYPVSKIVIR
jgi:hypothetical protein